MHHSPGARSEDRDEETAARRAVDRRFAVGLARAFGGAILFSFPMLMTMEMWWLGFYVAPLRLVLFMLLIIPVLIGLAYYAGFEENYHWKDFLLDPFVGYAVGFLTSAGMLFLFGVIGPGMSADEIIGKIAIQAVPASIGAMLARSQFGVKTGEELRRRSGRPGGGLFLMGVGALFLSFSLTSTEEMVLIGYKITEWQAAVLALASLLLIHGFAYAAPAEQESLPPAAPWWSGFLRTSVTGYALALLICFYVLWTFGRTDGTSAEQVVRAVVVAGFPAALGVAASRLLL